MNRIRFNDAKQDSGAYILPLNPSELELQDSHKQSVIEIIDGGNVVQNAYFDNRPIIMKWFNIPKDFQNFSDMLETLSSYVGNYKYVDFRDVDYRVNPTTWTKVLVGNLKTSVSQGGKIKYNVTLTLYPEVE